MHLLKMQEVGFISFCWIFWLVRMLKGILLILNGFKVVYFLKCFQNAQKRDE